MFDVYLSRSGHRLTVLEGEGLPKGAPGRWIKVRTVARVTDDTKDAIAMVGYHLHKLTSTFEETVKGR
jgi:hypothetical protein